ncbi:MAG: OmpA family protein [Bacteroidota bacterium]
MEPVVGILKNIRIAEGAVPLYDKLLTDGKIVTNDIHFEVNSDVLKPESMPVIDQIVQLMEQHPTVQFRIEGHTDSDGTDNHNLDLSERRAASVKKAIANKGINEGRMSTMGFGESKPVFPNNSEENKAKNRRVEFILIK